MGIKVGIKGATLRQVRVLQGKQVLSAFVIIIRVELEIISTCPSSRFREMKEEAAKDS